MPADHIHPTPPVAGEIVAVREFAAGRAAVFGAFADPGVLAQWWGPRGFTNEFHVFEFHPGGTWRFTMWAPDGAAFAIDHRFTEIVPEQRIVVRHLQAGHDFTITVELAERDGRTVLTWRQRFDDPAEGERLRDFLTGANEENLDRLAAVLAGSPFHPMNDPHLPTDTEIVISRILHAPRALVWEAWTNPQHVANWWGPRGFTTTTKRFEFRVGGHWEHTMHGPDGTNYPNKSRFLEIVAPERITYLHGGGSDLEDDERRGATFRATWTFEVVDAGRTRLTGRMVFPSREARDRVVRDYGAVEGGKQTLERAAEYVAGMQSEPFVLAREFAAPRDLVWRMWTEREHFARWFGPKDAKIEVCAFDLRPGGVNHYRLTMPNGAEMWGRAVYREIVPPRKLVWMNAFSDAAGGITVHPMNPHWPREMLTTVTLAERGAQTLVTVTWLPFDATESEHATFNAARPGMAGGWGGTFDRLTAYLADAAGDR